MKGQRQKVASGIYFAAYADKERGNLLGVLLWSLLLVGIAAAGVYGWFYMGAVPANGSSGIELRDIHYDQTGDSLSLRASARVRLPPTIEAGLNSGVALTFVLSMRVIKPRHWWRDATVFELERRYTLTYYELTRHYRVSALETNENRNFRSLTSALAGLAQLNRITVKLDEMQALHLQGDGLVALLSMKLAKSELPLPLQPIVRSSWTLMSEEYRWPVT